jgi:hypothetical protein
LSQGDGQASAIDKRVEKIVSRRTFTITRREPRSECSEFTSAFGGTKDIDGLSTGSAPSPMTHCGHFYAIA